MNAGRVSDTLQLALSRVQYNITTVIVLFTVDAREDYRHFTCCGSVVATRVTARRVCDYPDSQINDTGIFFTYDFTSAAKCVDKGM